MSQAQHGISVQILEKEYRIACSDEEKKSLTQAASLLDDKMHEIRDTGRIVGIERIAVMAALNLAHELLDIRDNKQLVSDDVSGRIRSLRKKLDKALINSDSEP